ncbi:MAG TPA: asparagine synthase-related protein, partial [Blastocatellia bacterium]|nr:asparagine synthase-related protein [Blastocatellia bacterium]
KFRRGQSKLLLREAFADFFPPALRNASKKGFNVPVAHYILGPLGEYFNASQQKDHPLRAQLGDEIGVTWRQGVIKWDFVQHLWNEFRQGRRDNSYELFALIAFDVWWRKYVSSGDRAMESLSHCAIA